MIRTELCLWNVFNEKLMIANGARLNMPWCAFWVALWRHGFGTYVPLLYFYLKMVSPVRAPDYSFRHMNFYPHAKQKLNSQVFVNNSIKIKGK